MLRCQRWLFRSNPHIAWQAPEAELETGAFPRTSSATPPLSCRDYIVTGKRIPAIGQSEYPPTLDIGCDGGSCAREVQTNARSRVFQRLRRPVRG